MGSLGNEKQGQPIMDCCSIAKLSEKEGQILRVAIIIDRQLLRRRLEEFRVCGVVEIQNLSVGERRC